MFAHPTCRNVFRIAIAALLAAVCGRVVANEFVFVQDGQPAATIVVDVKAADVAAFSAQELQYHVKKITGATLPIKSDAEKIDGAKILVGPSAATAQLGIDATQLKDQEYLIRFVGDALILLGKDTAGRVNVEKTPHWSKPTEARLPPPAMFDDQATSYATHDFLERFCDVRWFGPSELGLVVPKTATLAVEMNDIRRRPAFLYRHPYGTSVRMMMNQWNKPSPQEVQLFWSRLRVGGEPYRCNHSFTGYYDRFWKKNPKNRDVFVASHPDWFAQGYSDEEMKKMGLPPLPPQMCYSNQGFIDQVVADARDYFDGKGAKPGAMALGQYFGLGAMDNHCYCKCPACQAQLNRDTKDKQFSNDMASDYWYTFVNKVAREVAKTHPQGRLANIAYADYALYPSKVKVEPNVAIQLCLHVRNGWGPLTKDMDERFYQSWMTHAEGNRFYLWLYYCFPELMTTLTGGSWHCFPGFSAHALDRHLKQFARDGVRGAFIEGYGEQVDLYVSLRLLDDPSLSIDELLDDFFTRCYGAAAAPLKHFYLCVEDIYSNTKNYPENVQNRTISTHQTEEIAWKYLGTEARMAELGKLMDEATRLATTDIEKQRVAIFREAVWNYMVEGRKAYLAKQGK